MRLKALTVDGTKWNDITDRFERQLSGEWGDVRESLVDKLGISCVVLADELVDVDMTEPKLRC